VLTAVRLAVLDVDHCGPAQGVDECQGVPGLFGRGHGPFERECGVFIPAGGEQGGPECCQEGASPVTGAVGFVIDRGCGRFADAGGVAEEVPVDCPAGGDPRSHGVGARQERVQGLAAAGGLQPVVGFVDTADFLQSGGPDKA
jgi:hypothetical protein